MVSRVKRRVSRTLQPPQASQARNTGYILDTQDLGRNRLSLIRTALYLLIQSIIAHCIPVLQCTVYLNLNVLLKHKS